MDTARCKAFGAVAKLGTFTKAAEGPIPYVKRGKKQPRVFDEHAPAWIKSLVCLKNCDMTIVEIFGVVRFHRTTKGRSHFLLKQQDDDMKKELPHFNVGTAYGGAQDWCHTHWMKIGGCAAITACDCSLYFELYKGKTGLCPYAQDNISKEDYVDFAYVMEPYLRPRWTGIDRLDIYTDGFTSFLRDHQVTDIILSPWDGGSNLKDTIGIVRQQIDKGWPIPCLTLKHDNPAMDDYVWHWYILNGYEEFEDTLIVKAVSYGYWRWLDLKMIWTTGHDRKGGLILFS